jgi:hypothetical protein
MPETNPNSYRKIVALSRPGQSCLVSFRWRKIHGHKKDERNEKSMDEQLKVLGQTMTELQVDWTQLGRSSLW